MPFNETVGYFLVLLSISTTIFSFFDLIVLGPLAINSSYKAVKNQKSDYRFNVREIIKFTLKFVVEVGIIVGTFYLGMKIGGINLF